MGNLLTIIISGMGTGMLYGIVGMGLVLIYRSSKVLNFAYGDMVTMTAYIAYTLALILQWNYFLVFIVTLVFGGVFGYVVKRGLIDSLGREHGKSWKIYGMYSEDTLLNMVIGTVGFSLIIEGLEGAIWGQSTMTIPSIGGNTTLSFASIHVSLDTIITIIAVLLVSLLLWLFLNHSSLGQQIQATYENPLGAALIGINVKRVFSAVWIISVGLAGLAAIFAAPVTYINQASLVSFAFIGFVAVIIGGLENVFGAMLGGLLLGVAQNLISAFFSSQYEQIIIFIFLLVVLFIRPYGLFTGSARHFNRV
jgi:branched-chain amino acid transport system permease protein